MATIFLLNKSKRLHVIDGVSILPTSAREVEEGVLHYIGVKSAIENGELEVVNEERDPILTKEEAEADSKAKKSGKVSVPDAPAPKPARKTASKPEE